MWQRPRHSLTRSRVLDLPPRNRPGRSAEQRSCRPVLVVLHQCEPCLATYQQAVGPCAVHGVLSWPRLAADITSASVPVDPRVISCKAGDEVLGAQVLLVGHATNFSGREAKAILTMFFSPHEGTPPAPSQTTGAPSR